MQSAAKVGLLLVAFVALLVGAYTILGKNLFRPQADVYYVDLPDAGGITEGADVLMAGVSIGTVGEVRLASPRSARLRLDIRKGTQIPEGSVVQLPTSLLGFGDNPVSIMPPEKITAGLLQPGSTLPGSKASPIENLLPGSRQSFAALSKTMAAVQRLLEDKGLQTRVENLLDTSNKTLEKFGNLASDANSLLAANEGAITRAVTTATAAVQDVHRVTMKVAELVQDGKLKKDATAIMDRLNTISRHADEMLQSLNKLINDPKLRGPVAESAANVADITKTGKSIATNVDNMTRNGNTIAENAVVVSKKAIVLTDKANEIATKASQIEDQLKGVLDKVGGFFNKAPSVSSLSKITTELDLLRQTNPGYWRTDLTLYYPIQDSTVSLGLFDFLNTNKLILELQRPLTDRLDYRYGIYGDSASVGVDYRLASRLSVRGDLWDINYPRFDIRTNYDFGSGIIGWLGADSVLNKPSLILGVGVKK